MPFGLKVLADFLAEMTPTSPIKPTDLLWIIHVDGSSNNKGSGVSLFLENQDGLVVEVSLTYSFTVSNNQAEYEARIAGL